MSWSSRWAIPAWLTSSRRDRSPTARVVDVPCDTHLPLARARNRGASVAFHELGAELVIFLDVDCLAGATLLRGYRDGWRRTGPTPRVLSGPVSYLDPPGPDGYRAAELAAARPHPARPAPAPGTWS